ncbi:hypothetical protein JB92DRAFT_3151198 [Gautieria morchelliformis]|nr:hypothetical protein JB92DRAFT_3151198 [Gautieria morchelliformis]
MCCYCPSIALSASEPSNAAPTCFLYSVALALPMCAAEAMGCSPCAAWQEEKQDTLIQNRQAGPAGKNESSAPGQPRRRGQCPHNSGNINTTNRCLVRAKRQPPLNTLDPNVASISSIVLPATRIFLTLSRPRYCIPEVIRGLGDTRHIQCHRILHEFHTENAPPYLLHGISILIALQIRQFLEGIGLPVTSSMPPSVSS